MADDAAVFRLFEGLPRQGPGSDACTREALRRLPPLPPAPRVLDLGCGAGRQTLVLAEALRTKVLAVDLHQPFLDQLRASARARGLADLVETRCADMGALDLAPGSVDLLWSEGAVYLLGFEAGLRRWRPLLAPKGLAAVSECSWLTEQPPADLAAFWQQAYPAMGTVEGNLARAERAGFEPLDWWPLPQAAWWDDFYTPLAERLAALAGEPALVAAIAETQAEIELFCRHGDRYGYGFYLLRARG
jgi:serine/threonine-protein kinase HipA